MRGIFAVLFCLLTMAAQAQTALAVDETHMIGLSHGYVETDGQIHGPRADILLDRHGKSVALVLGSYEPLRWYVEMSEGTDLSRVILFGRAGGRSEVIVNGARVAVEVINVLDQPTNKLAPNLPRVAAEVADAAGLGSIDRFVTSDDPTTKPFRIVSAYAGIEIPTPEPVTVSQEAVAALPEVFAQIVAEGRPPARWLRVGVERGDLLIVRPDNTELRIPVSLDVPPLSHVVAVVEVPEQGAYYVVTLGGEGFLYRLETATNTWSVLRSMEGADALDMIYDPEGRALILHFGGHVQTQSLVSGEVTRWPSVPVQLPAWDLPLGENRLNPNNLEVYAAHGTQLLFGVSVHAPPPQERRYRMWTHNLETGEIALVLSQDAP